MALKVPPPSRIAIGMATVAGQQVEVFLHPEWARYFDSLTTLSNVTAAAVGLPGAPGTTGAAGVGVALNDDAVGNFEFIPGPSGPIGPQGAPGPAVLFLQDAGDGSDALPAIPSQPTEPPVAPTLLNSWVDFGAGFSPTSYFKDGNGVVHLRGLVKSGLVGNTIFTLPVGYRPIGEEAFAVASNDAFGRCDVTAAGAVIPMVGSNIYFSLSGISFRAGQ